MANRPDINALFAQAESLAADVSGEPATSSPPSRASQGPRAGFATGAPPQLQRILQLQVPVIVQLAKRDMCMREVLELNVGSIIEFERRFDSELELLVADRQVGLGRAVKVGENFGLRVTRLGTIYETIKALGGV